MHIGKIASLCACLGLLTVQQAFAQNQVVPGRANVQASVGVSGNPGIFPYGGFGYGGFGMPGTAASSAEFGMASVIAASGYANLQNSMAAQNFESARTQDYNNRLLWTRTYYTMRQEHRAYVADHTRLSMDEITKIAHDAAPKRLDPTQIDPHTGKLHWPLILQDPRYAEACEDLQTLYNARANTSGFVNAESYRDINKSCETLLNLLKTNIDDYSANDYEAARHFIDSVRYESRFPAS